MKGLQARLKQDPTEYLAIGSGDDITQRVKEFIDAGCSKFVLIPIADGTGDLLNQTERLIQEVLPRFD